MIHHAAGEFWDCYRSLPTQVQDAADRAFALLKADLKHPSIHFKKIDKFWSARIGLHYRALALRVFGPEYAACQAPVEVAPDDQFLSEPEPDERPPHSHRKRCPKV